jgi:cell division protein FtsQ
MDRPFAAPLAPQLRLHLPSPRRLLSGRRGRLLAVALVLGALLLGGGWMLLRHSPLVTASDVHVSGLSGPEAGAIEAALVGAAHHMSTLDASAGALRAAVAPFRVVQELHVSTSFPHGLNIDVVERLPVAALTAAGTRTAVAADGVVLGPALLQASLPTLTASLLPPVGQRVKDGTLLAGLAVLGAAPGPLRPHVASVQNGARGVTMTMRNGLLVYFGDATLAHAKWQALVRVLADASSAGAGYVDVRLPSRPAAGFAAGVTPPAATSSTSAEASGSHGPESAVSSLASGLAPPGSTASTTPEPATGSHESEEASSTGAEGG